MKKSILIVGLLPLIGIALFYCFARPPEVKQPANLQPAIKKESPAASKTDKWVEAELRRKQLEDKINEGMAKIAKHKTPELQREILETKMRTLEPQYRKLFESWGLDSGNFDKTMAIIRERESRLQEALRKHDEQGLAGGREFVVTTTTETALAETQLIDLLGASRFKELSRLESEIKATDIARAKKAINSRD